MLVKGVRFLTMKSKETLAKETIEFVYKKEFRTQEHTWLNHSVRVNIWQHFSLNYSQYYLSVISLFK